MQPRRRVVGPGGQHEQHAGGRRPVQQAGREIDGRGVRPVEVVEDEHQRLGGRQPFEQLADRPVGPVALVQDSRQTRRGRGPTTTGRPARARHARLRRGSPGVCGSTPARYSSSASTKTQNGRSRSRSAPAPPRTMCPRVSARAASSASSRVLPMPAAPRISIAWARRPSSSSSAASSSESSGRRPTKWAASADIVVSARAYGRVGARPRAPADGPGRDTGRALMSDRRSAASLRP